MNNWWTQFSHWIWYRFQADMRVNKWMCALNGACIHVRCAQNSARMRMWCMYAMHCVWFVCVCTFVHLLCSCPLWSPCELRVTWILFVFGNWRRTWRIQFAKCVWHSKRILPPIHTLYLKKSKSWADFENIRRQLFDMIRYLDYAWKQVHVANWFHNMRLTCQAHFVYACHMNTNWWTKVQTKCRPSVDPVYITL